MKSISERMRMLGIEILERLSEHPVRAFMAALIIMAIFIVPLFPDKDTVPADKRYAWGQYLTKEECNRIGSMGMDHGSRDRLSRIYDMQGKRMRVTESLGIGLSDKRMSEIWTCFENGYDIAYYQRY